VSEYHCETGRKTDQSEYKQDRPLGDHDFDFRISARQRNGCEQNGQKSDETRKEDR
jgi:hypothetical protein